MRIGTDTKCWIAACCLVAGFAPVAAMAGSNSNHPYFNSDEPGCDPNSPNPNYLMCDDFDDGTAQSSGGQCLGTDSDGWSTSYCPTTMFGVEPGRCDSTAVGGDGCYANSGPVDGPNVDFLHELRNHPHEEIWWRFYYRAQPVNGELRWHFEKMFHTVNDNTCGGEWHISVHSDETGSNDDEHIRAQVRGIGTASNRWWNLDPPIIVPGPNHSSGERFENWWYWEIHVVRPSSESASDGVFEIWADDCGPTGMNCPSTPTLRHRDRSANLNYLNNGIQGVCFLNWSPSGPTSKGTRQYDQVIVSRTGPIGPMGGPGGPTPPPPPPPPAGPPASPTLLD